MGQNQVHWLMVVRWIDANEDIQNFCFGHQDADRASSLEDVPAIALPLFACMYDRAGFC